MRRDKTAFFEVDRKAALKSTHQREYHDKSLDDFCEDFNQKASAATKPEPKHFFFRVIKYEDANYCIEVNYQTGLNEKIEKHVEDDTKVLTFASTKFILYSVNSKFEILTGTIYRPLARPAALEFVSDANNDPSLREGSQERSGDFCKVFKQDRLYSCPV